MRTRFLSVAATAVALLSGAASAGTYRLVVDETTVNYTGRERPAMSINGSIPAPALRWKEGEEVTIEVTNKLDEDTSIHWHGIILPNDQDGVPGMTFAGIKPGETFTYRFKVQQSGTYWYHSHSGMQEAIGMYGPIIIEPAKPEYYAYDREYTVMFSDWHDQSPHRILANLKKYPGYYNYNKRTLGDFFRDLGKAEDKRAVLQDRLDWAQMRMDPTDLADVTGFTFLTNGKTPEQNWTGIFRPGEKVRLRLINGSAMSYYDFRIPGLKMTVVQADGQDVEPVVVDELRIAVAETYDVIVEPEDRAYTLFAEAFDRSGYARGTLAPREGMSAEIPPLREPPLLTMADMGMDHGEHGGGHGSMHGGETSSDHGNHGDHEPGEHQGGAHGMAHSDMGSDHHGQMAHGDHAPMHHGNNGQSGHGGMNHGAPASGSSHGHSMHRDHHAPQPRELPPAPDAPTWPGHGNSTPSVGRSLTYADLRAAYDKPEHREPDREIVIRLTGNMERFIWSINEKKFSEAPPIQLELGERVRFKFVNETMMNHPMHLHGMWMEPVNGQDEKSPRKHVVNIPPGQTYSVDVNVDAPGDWAFHCHLMYHMDAGMFRMVTVAEAK